MFNLRKLGYESEEQLVAKAKSDARSYEVLRLFAGQLSESIAERYALRSGLSLVTLTAVGMAEFDRSLNAYRRRVSELGHVPYKFTTYFSERLLRAMKGHLGEPITTRLATSR
jgi:hypothetical protein